MKKVKNRAWASLLIALLLVVGLAVYLVRLAEDGGAEILARVYAQ